MKNEQIWEIIMFILIIQGLFFIFRNDDFILMLIVLIITYIFGRLGGK